MSEILALAQRAWDKTVFFKNHYSARPNLPAEIEPTSFVAYHQAGCLEDCLIDPEELLGAIPAFYRGNRKLPINVVESEHEWRYRHQRFVRALEDHGVHVDRPDQKILVVADDATGPFGCELSKFLSWNKIQAPISFNADSLEILKQDIRDIQPDHLLILPASFLNAPLKDIENCIYFSQISDISAARAELPTIVVCDTIHVLAAKPSGQDKLLFDSESLLIERDSASGFSLVTNLKHDFFPIIRYQVDVPFDRLAPRPRKAGSDG